MKKYPQALGPYSAFKKAGNLIFVSGQLGIEPESGEFVSNDVKDQAARALKNAEAILEEAGASLNEVVKATILLADINDFAAVNETYASFFKVPFPARSAFAVKDLPKKALVEIELIAYKD